MLFIHSGVDVALNGQILKRLLDGPAAQAVNLGLELMYTFAFPLRTFMDQMQNILVDEVKVVVLAILLYLIYFWWRTGSRGHLVGFIQHHMCTDCFQNMCGELIHVLQDSDIQDVEALYFFKTSEDTDHFDIYLH